MHKTFFCIHISHNDSVSKIKEECQPTPEQKPGLEQQEKIILDCF